jgi:hypothetical protein
LWPKAAGDVVFRLINKFLNAPLHCTNLKVFCGPTTNRRVAQFWSAQVNSSTCLTTFSVQEKRLSCKMLSGAAPVGLTKGGTEWKIKTVDDHHIKLYFDGSWFTFF